MGDAEVQQRGTPRGDDGEPNAKSARILNLSVNSVIGPSNETNYEVNEEPFDFS